MTKKYDPKKVETKWQKIWETENAFAAKNSSKKPKFYYLIEFPYPSGAGLHVGHLRSYVALDAMARIKRMQGYNVLYPIGWDAFGLPAEQYAIKNHIHPAEAVKQNIVNFKKQIKTVGISFDWDREINTTDPKYYKWTQWQFLQFYKHNMAYKDKKEINWCPNCKIGLSNEESSGGVCERCGGKVEKRLKEQWMLRMRDYAEILLKGLDKTEFIDRVKNAQIEWIGKSEGATINFPIKGRDEKISVFTTRPDTIFGATFIVISPENEFITKNIDIINNKKEVWKYQEKASEKSDIERTDATREKTGVLLEGVVAINPVNNKELPIYISDYVLNDYGTGAIMAVPAHDSRDYEFAKKHGIEIIQVIEGGNIKQAAYEGDGKHINSDFLNGLDQANAIAKIVKYLSDNNLGEKTINYKLQDWVFSRQRFWGEPIPMIYCEKCGWVPVPDKDLPVKLPEIKSYAPTDDGESPLARITEWVNTVCPKCGGKAKRETDTMPNWAGSSWYWLRYMDPDDENTFASEKAMKYWNMVDYYNGGMEHAARHLLYARFWHNFLYNQKLVPFPEPFKKRVAHGMILGPDGLKMSKSKGNVINPDNVIEDVGADTLRCYEMFIGDYKEDAAWTDNGLYGCKRFLDKIWNLQNRLNNKKGYTKELETLINQTIEKVTNDINSMKYNTAVSSLMILTNAYDKEKTITKKDYRTLLHLLNPICPHITEEINEECKLGKTLYLSDWPQYDNNVIEQADKKIAVQVNGKMRALIIVPSSFSENEVVSKAKEAVNKYLLGKKIKRVIYIEGRLVNIVVD
ncbi:leucine--tRNA ligase [Candidatus Saccharibacteria bacterium]|nr:leucine--tRNA ligase [Candidatus Saccharibacteria bacterium]